MSKYFTDAEIRQLVQETEAEIDRRQAQQAEHRRMQAITAWINDPRNKSVIDADPMVQKLRAMNQPMQQAQAPAAATGYKSRQQLEAERPWLRARKPEVQSIIDPIAGRRIN
jgi:hypothetical protein